MIEIQNNKILLDGKELQFDNKIIEAAEYEYSRIREDAFRARSSTFKSGCASRT